MNIHFYDDKTRRKMRRIEKEKRDRKQGRESSKAAHRQPKTKLRRQRQREDN